MKKESKPEVLYAINLDHKEFVSTSVVPVFYDIIKDKDRFAVRYFGCCKVYDDTTLEGAKEYILNNARYITTSDGEIVVYDVGRRE